MAKRPGDLVKVDTFGVGLFPCLTFKQFTARDAVSKWDVIEG